MQDKDPYGNPISFDSNKKIIMKNYTYDFRTTFHQEIKTIPIGDSIFLQQEQDRRTQQLQEINQILSRSPYQNYSPFYLDYTFKGPQANLDYEYFLKWKNIYLKEPENKTISPWDIEEKAYYLSLKTKKERYIYLVKRSGLKSAIIEIPDSGIGNAQGFKEIAKIVEANRNTLQSDLHMGEWGICAGILGDAKGFAEGTAVGNIRSGFKARGRQSSFLYFQLTGDLKALYERYLIGSFCYGGVDTRPLKASLIKTLIANPPLDEFGMIPFLDEIITPDWIMDFSKIDPLGDITQALQKEIEAGKILDPRHINATPQSKKDFKNKVDFLLERSLIVQSFDTPNDPKWDLNSQKLTHEMRILEAKIMAVTPPDGYPNAPYYYFPQDLEKKYQIGKLDKRLDPRIPAMRRISFPDDLKQKIRDFIQKTKRI